MSKDRERRSPNVVEFRRRQRQPQGRNRSQPQQLRTGGHGRTWIGMVVVGALIAGAYWLVAPDSILPDRPPAGGMASGQIAGVVTHVRDGDTIEIAGQAIRLNGLHAPELDEPLGAQARSFMAAMVDGREIVCELNGERSYDRLVGRCFLDGEDIAASLVASGYARDCPRHSGGRYSEFERETTLTLPPYC